MDFISNSKEQVEEMLRSIGVGTVEELFCDVPRDLLRKAIATDDGLSELEGERLMEGLAEENVAPRMDSYLGAGAYDHHVPALVGAVCQKSEFLTAYTPYQPEASQGMLQAIFEFQSAVCALTGMDVSNASVYDAASACAEAVLMSLRHRRKATHILVHEGVHPHYLAVIRQYLANSEVVVDLFSDFETLSFEGAVASVLVQSPNFFGEVEDVAALYARAKEAGVIGIHCGNPLSYGLYASPGELGADIAVGDTQPFGVGLQYGGPYVGYMACRTELVRQMPGRIVGETEDTEGRPGFVLTLQPREQHIRREKATSNICSNQALAALASLVAILYYGKEGVPALAKTNFQRASYLRDALARVSGITCDLTIPIFNEFVVTLDRPAAELLERLRKEGIEAGVDLGRFYPDRDNELLICVTETKTKAQLDRFVAKVEEVAHASALHL